MSKAKLSSLFRVLSLPQAADLSATDKLVLVYLCWRQGDNEAAWPSLRTIEADLHIGRRTCVRSLARLGESDCIQKTPGRRGRGHSNRYVVLTEKRCQGATFSEEIKGSNVTPFSERKGSKLAPEKVSGCYLKEQGKEPSASAPRARPVGPRGGRQKRKLKTARRQSSQPLLPPTADEVRTYATSKGYPDFDAQKFIDYYEAGDWHDSRGKPVRSWKQKLLAVWLKPVDTGHEPEQDIGKLAGCEPADEDDAARVYEEAGLIEE